ncbi:MAG: Cysteine-rich secretory protein family protein [Planctomycetes bacterium ADurb.Bin126]|nr:MAG: Cysteine-rich secretory protein family protein [Planctomycetes bacterium ADurb.Bin126]HOD80952.1 CAP domain-containing protein [Phycisphaerae bacterium]
MWTRSESHRRLIRRATCGLLVLLAAGPVWAAVSRESGDKADELTIEQKRQIAAYRAAANGPNFVKVVAALKGLEEMGPPAKEELEKLLKSLLARHGNLVLAAARAAGPADASAQADKELADLRAEALANIAVLKKGDDSIPKAEAYYKKLIPLAKRSVAALEARSRLVDALAQWAVLKDISTRSQSGALVIETSEAASPAPASKPAAPDPLEAARKALGAPLVGFGGEQDIEQEPALKDLVLHRLNRRTAEWNRRLAGECHAQELANIQAVNDYRETLGLARMEIDLRLMQAARGHSKEMTDLKYFSHVSPTKGREGFGDRCRLAGYQGAGGENIASANNVTGQQAFQMWFHSPGHHQNMANAGFTAIGVGKWGSIMTQNFGGGQRLVLADEETRKAAAPKGELVGKSK